MQGRDNGNPRGKNKGKTGQVTAHDTEHDTAHDTEHVSEELLRLLAVLEGEMKRADIQSALGLQHREYFRSAYLKPSLMKNLIEMTIPDKPKSKLQKYRLTAKGKAVLHTVSKKKQEESFD